MDPGGEISQLIEAGSSLDEGGINKLTGLRRVLIPGREAKLKIDQGIDEPLLRAVVQVTYHLAPGCVGGRDKPLSGRPELGRPCLGDVALSNGSR